MSTFIDSIFDKIGNVILPKTVTKAVWGQTSGNRLDQELDGIEAALAQPNTGDNADIAYSAGKYIYHVKNKELYRAKSNIASGAAFNKASGGNVDVVNIGDQLQTISSDLADKAPIGSTMIPRGELPTLTSDTQIISLAFGSYLHFRSDSYIPTQYGVLIVFPAGSSYKPFMYLSYDGTMYYRMANVANQTWYSAWKMVTAT